MPRRSKKIRAIAIGLLDSYEIVSPPVDVRYIAQQLDIEVREGDLKDISGLVFREGSKVIIGVNKKHNSKRQRFTIAHELGHHLLHSQSPLYVDKVFAVRLRDHISSEAISAEEIEANAFAAELLMPSNMMRDEISQSINILDYEKEGLNKIIAHLASRYDVSEQAMTIRLINMGFIQDNM